MEEYQVQMKVAYSGKGNVPEISKEYLEQDDSDQEVEIGTSRNYSETKEREAEEKILAAKRGVKRSHSSEEEVLDYDEDELFGSDESEDEASKPRKKRK